MGAGTHERRARGQLALVLAALLLACEQPPGAEPASPHAPPRASALAPAPASGPGGSAPPARGEARPSAAPDAPAGVYEGRPIAEEERVDRLVAFKAAHRLEAYAGERLLKTYRIAIGRGAKGPKRFEGDLKTPEGTYAISGRHRSTQFHLFLEVSYPNESDLSAHRAGFEDGSVPRGVGPGGAIGIHGERRGVPRAKNKARDWTAGCIAVDDAEIEELYRVVAKGALLEIRP